MFQALIENDFPTLYKNWISLYLAETDFEEVVAKHGNELPHVEVIYSALKHYIKHDIITGCSWGRNVELIDDDFRELKKRLLEN
jgi:hypothetical protein